MVIREPVMKGILQEFYHQHNKISPLLRDNKDERQMSLDWYAAHRDAFLTLLQKTIGGQPLVAIAR